MSKAVDAFRTISEVSEELNVPKHVLRFWEQKFPQIKPMKRGGGRRYYRPEDMELLRGIRHLLHAEAYTIKGVQKILRTQGIDAVKTAAQASSIAAVAAVNAVAAKVRRRKGRVAAAGETATALRAAPAASTSGGRTGKPLVGRAGGFDETTRATLMAAIAELEACRGLLMPAAITAPAAVARNAEGNRRRARG